MTPSVSEPLVQVALTVIVEVVPPTTLAGAGVAEVVNTGVPPPPLPAMKFRTVTEMAGTVRV